jgi:hypothetical protein
MKNNTPHLLALGAALLLAPLTSTFATPSWETVDNLTPWRGRDIVSDANGNFGSVAQTAGKKRGKRAWTSTAERRERRLGSRRSARFNLRSKAGVCERPENAKSGWPSLTDSGLNRV